MEKKVEKKPIYDDRVNQIIRGLLEGKSRDALAKELGYKNYKTLDIYMRRRNFTWDTIHKKYVPVYDRANKLDLDTALHRSSKVSTIIALFRKEDTDAKTIAKLTGFTDHRELAAYMKAKGYRWSSTLGNYQKISGEIYDEPYMPDIPREPEETTTSSEALRQPAVASKAGAKGEIPPERYMPLLELLERNRDRLVNLLMSYETNAKVPRYAVPGVFVTKSVHMTNTLDQLVREYSKEKNISQRDIFAVALIEFFQKYGYEREINALLDGM